MENLRPNEQRARNAIILICIVLALEVVSLISGYFRYELLQVVANGGTISIEEANANDTRERFITIISFIAFIISAITFIQWFRRAYFNLKLKVNYLTESDGWVAGSWFVPIVCLYKPYQIMKEMYMETRELLTKKGITFNQSFSTNTLGWWWALWIIVNLIGQFIFQYTMHAKIVDEYITSTIAGMIQNIMGIPLALITIKVIKDYSNVEPLLNEIKEEEETTVE